MQISEARRMASWAISRAPSLVCRASARAAASANGPPEPMAQIPSSRPIPPPAAEGREGGGAAGGKRKGCARADGADTVVRLDHVAVAGKQEGGLCVGHHQQRIQVTE